MIAIKGRSTSFRHFGNVRFFAQRSFPVAELRQVELRTWSATTRTDAPGSATSSSCSRPTSQFSIRYKRAIRDGNAHRRTLRLERPAAFQPVCLRSAVLSLLSFLCALRALLHLCVDVGSSKAVNSK